MGSCYSRKARDGKYSYSDVQMASTKVEETSRLARPTPYTRNLVSSFSLKKSISPHTKYEPSSVAYNANEQNEKLQQKSTSSLAFQSNIPRISSTPAAGSTDTSQNTLDTNCNKNEDVELHFVNNNAMSTSVSDSIQVANTSKVPKKFAEPKLEKISTSGKTDEKNAPSHIPAKFSAHIMGLPRPQVPQYVGKTSAHTLSHVNSDNQPAPKLHSHSADKLVSEKKSVCANDVYVDFLDEQEPLQSPPRATSAGDSQDSMTDIDSGLGNSLVEKGKQEDADTLKDAEYLESCEESPINHVAPCQNELSSVAKATYGLKNLKIEDKTCLRSPMYRREPNGKWIIDDKHIGSLQKHLKSENGQELQSGLQLYLSSPSIPRYKADSYDNYSSYASYKGLLSYKKQSPFKQMDSSTPARVKFEKGYQSDSSGIPKVKKTVTKDGSCSKLPRSMLNLSGSDKNLVNAAGVRKTYKIELPSDSKQSSPESDDKSDSIGNGIGSPVSELENREFLIDDEIADQPGLISFENSKLIDSDVPSLQQSVTELHALQQAASSSRKHSDSQGSYSSSSRLFRDRSNTDARDSLILGSDMCSSCSSIGSDDLMLDYEKTCDNFPDGTVNEGPASPVKQQVDVDSIAEDKILPLRRERKSVVEAEERTRKWLYRRSSGPFYGGTPGNSYGKMDWRLRSVSLPLRPPRQMIVTEGEDGSIKLDPSSYRLLCQDLNGVKTLLLRLKTVIQEAETLNPFDQTNPKNIFYHNLAHSDFPSGTVFSAEETQEMESSSAAMLLQENVDLRRQLVLLQQQLEEKDHTIHLLQQQMTKYTNFHNPDSGNICTNNAATQTDRVRSSTGSLSGSSSSADDSSETLVSVQDAFEEHFSKTLKEQDNFRNQMEKVTRSLSNLNQNLRVTAEKYPYLTNRSVSSSELTCYQNSS